MTDGLKSKLFGSYSSHALNKELFHIQVPTVLVKSSISKPTKCYEFCFQGNHEIGGRHIDVKKAVSREEMGGGGGRGGGGRGGRGGRGEGRGRVSCL